MAEYYLDIETNPKGPNPDVENDEILTIQFQRLGTTSDRKQGDLIILKSWESSEENILKDVLQRYIGTMSKQKEIEILNIDTKVENDGLVINQYIEYDKEFDRLIHMPDYEFKQEIISMSDSGLERYMKMN